MSEILVNQKLFAEQAFLNGKFLPSKSGQTFKVFNPATAEVIAHVSECGVEDVDIAIKHAEKAFDSFKLTSPRYRAKILRKWYDLMIENAEDLAKIITLENGKPLSEAKGEIAYSSSFLEWFSEEAPRLFGETIHTSNPANRVFTIKQPIGVCGIVTPWNFPSAMITRKISAAIAAGCTTVIKPAAETPLSALALAYLAREAGIPDGVINVVTTEMNTKDIGLALCQSKIVRKLSFTGSTSVGKTLMSQSASTLKKLSFELGGNAPFIVFEDADVDAAVEGAIICKFRHTGQTCVCANRFYVHTKVYDEFSKKLLEKVKDFKVGSGFESTSTHGPLIYERAVTKVQSHITDAVSKGAEVLTGGKPLGNLGPNFHELTILGKVNSTMICTKEETFGPVAALLPFETEEEVIRLANKAEVGLAGYFYSRDIGRVYRVAEAIEAGMIGVNTGAISDAAMPFGGVKESGFGREGSSYGIDEYTVVKAITIGDIYRAN